MQCRAKYDKLSNGHPGGWSLNQRVTIRTHGITPTFAVLSTLLIGTVHAQDYSGPRYMWGDWGWGHMIFGSLMMVLFWGGIILVVVLLVRWLGGRSTGAAAPPPGKTALDILKERFARGEIDKDEFEERKRLLSD